MIISSIAHANEFYFIGGYYSINTPTLSPMKVAGLTFLGPSTSTFWETEISGKMRAEFAADIAYRIPEDKIQFLPTHTKSGKLRPTRWVSDKQAYANVEAEVRMGAIVNSPKANLLPNAVKIEEAEIVTLLKNSKNQTYKEFSSKVDMNDLNVGTWKGKEYGEAKASAKLIDPSDMKLPKNVLTAIEKEIAKYAKSEKSATSDLDIKILLRLKGYNQKNGAETIDYLISSDSLKNQNLLSLRGLKAILGISSASRFIDDLFCTDGVEVKSPNTVGRSTIYESLTISGSEDKK